MREKWPSKAINEKKMALIGTSWETIDTIAETSMPIRDNERKMALIGTLWETIDTIAAT